MIRENYEVGEKPNRSCSYLTMDNKLIGTHGSGGHQENFTIEGRDGQSNFRNGTRVHIPGCGQHTGTFKRDCCVYYNCYPNLPDAGAGVL